MSRVDEPQDVCQANDLLAGFVEEGYPEGLGETLPELVAGPHLQRLAVAHHGFGGPGGGGAGEPFPVGFAAGEHGDGQHVDHEVLVDVGAGCAGRRS